MTDTAPLTDATLAAIEAALADALVPIPGLDGYSGTRDGRIFSTKSNWRGYGVREMKTTLNDDGYLEVDLTVSPKRSKKFRVHKLLALTFVSPQPSPLHEVRHLDGSRTNNNVSNLAWGTRLDNATDRMRHGTSAFGSRNGAYTHPERMPRGDRNGSRLHPERLARGEKSGSRLHPDRVPKGERHGCAVLTEDDVRQIRHLLSQGVGCMAIAKKYAVNSRRIYAIKRGENWKHVK